MRGSVDTNKGWEYEKELLSDLAHYAVFANAAYGWKLGFALSGILHLGDMKALIKKTGVRKEDIVATRWHSRTYLPVSEKRSLPYSDIVQMGYFSPENILKILFTRCTKAYFIVRDVKRKHIVLCINQQSFKEEEGGIDLTKIRSKYRARAHQGMLEGARGVSKMTRKIIAAELASNPEYKLVIVGHSLGGGAAAVLGTMWQDTFPGLIVYSYGSPCVGPIDSNPTLNDSISK